MLYFGQFNKNICEGFFEFILICSSTKRLKLFIDYFAKIDKSLSEYNGIIYKNRTKRFPFELDQEPIFYRQNAIPGYLINNILSKIGNPQDFVQRETQRVMQSFKDNIKYL